MQYSEAPTIQTPDDAHVQPMDDTTEVDRGMQNFMLLLCSVTIGKFSEYYFVILQTM